MRKEYRTDYMVGHGKGGSKDNLARQQVNLNYRQLSHPELQALYASNQFVQNIVDIPAEDLTRAWIELKMDDAQLKERLRERMRDLNCKETFTDMRRYERLHGDGFVAIGARQSSAFSLSEPLDPRKLKGIDYLNAFSSYKVGALYINEDPFSLDYGQLDSIQLNRMSTIGLTLTQGITTDPGQTQIHRSRLFHDQTRRLENQQKGQSVLEPLFDVITMFDTAMWSVGQILYDFTFKVYRSPGVDRLSKEDKLEMAMLADHAFRTEALALIGKDEELTKVATSVAGIKDLLDYVWDALSGGAKMPKSVIKGQESGTITGAQYDVLNYYSRIAAAQETELRPLLERLIRYMLICEGQDPEAVKWELVFNPLWSVDQETDAKIRKMNAETDQIYITTGVLDSDQVREQRYPGLKPAESELKTDSLNDEELAELVKAAQKRFSGE